MQGVLCVDTLGDSGLLQRQSAQHCALNSVSSGLHTACGASALSSSSSSSSCGALSTPLGSSGPAPPPWLLPLAFFLLFFFFLLATCTPRQPCTLSSFARPLPAATPGMGECRGRTRFIDAVGRVDRGHFAVWNRWTVQWSTRAALQGTRLGMVKRRGQYMRY